MPSSRVRCGPGDISCSVLQGKVVNPCPEPTRAHHQNRLEPFDDLRLHSRLGPDPSASAKRAHLRWYSRARTVSAYSNVLSEAYDGVSCRSLGDE